MAKYEITYVPNSASEKQGLETDVDALGHRVVGRFIPFYKSGGEPVLQVAAAHVLQIKTVSQ